MRRRTPASFLSMVQFAGGLAAAALAFEAGLQLIRHTPLWRALPIVEPILGKPDLAIGYTFVPNAWGVWPKENRAVVAINSLGLRDSPMTVAKPAGVIRVALTGDSMVEALQVDHALTFERIAEQTLARRGQPVEIANFAMAGNGGLRQLARLESAAAGIQFDMILMIMSISDFSSGELLNDSVAPGYVEGPDGLQRGYAFRSRFAQRHEDDAFGRAFVALYQTSETFRMLYNVQRSPLRTQLGLPPAASPATASAERPCGADEIDRAAAIWLGAQPDPKRQAANKLFDEIGALRQARGIPFVVAVRGLPVVAESCVVERQVRARIVDAITNALAAEGIDVIDWEAALASHLGLADAAAAATLARLHGFGTNIGAGHLNYDGHRAYAGVLAAAIDRRLRTTP